ncbi:MAG: very short patch repair endonuclease, partial [Candidatus Omnitrophica bacterium CG12_big_fil_rev_8_21_14_0_65_45_16]
MMRTKKQISFNMSRIRSKESLIERLFERALKSARL